MSTCKDSQDEDLLMDFVLPEMNKVCSRLLAMNKAKKDRCAHHVSRQDSFASQAATVSNEDGQDNE